jgi:hypothetical protein
MLKWYRLVDALQRLPTSSKQSGVVCIHGMPALCARGNGVASQEVTICLPRSALRSAEKSPRSLRLSYRHNDERWAVDGPLQRDVYSTVAELHDATAEPAVSKGLDLELGDGGNCLVVRKRPPDVITEVEC